MSEYYIRSGRQYGESYYHVMRKTDIVGGMNVLIESYSTEGGAKVALQKLTGERFTKLDNPTLEALQTRIIELQAYIVELEGYLK